MFSEEKKWFHFYHKVGEGGMEALSREPIYSPTYVSWENSPFPECFYLLCSITTLIDMRFCSLTMLALRSRVHMF